jgi:hypothetical protein
MLTISEVWAATAQVNLTPELNPSAQRCLPGFSTVDFNF